MQVLIFYEKKLIGMKKIVIAISREFGSGGRIVGKKLAEELSIPLYDRKLIELAAEKSGLSPDFIARNEDRVSSSLLFNMVAHIEGEVSLFPKYEMSVADQAFFAQAEVIRDLAKKESCIILGRCGGYILREDPNCISVFLHGRLEDRISLGIKMYGHDPEGLADKYVKADRGRASYHKHYTGENWDNIRAYNLAIDTSAVGTDGAVNTILTYIESRN